MENKREGRVIIVKIIKALYPLIVITVFVSVMAGFRHELTLSDKERGTITEQLNSIQTVAATENSSESDEEGYSNDLHILEAGTNETFYEYESLEESVVHLEASGELWFTLHDEESGEKIAEGLWHEGDQREWDLSSSEKFRFDFGNIYNATIHINEEEIEFSEVDPVHQLHFQSSNKSVAVN